MSRKSKKLEAKTQPPPGHEKSDLFEEHLYKTYRAESSWFIKIISTVVGGTIFGALTYAKDSSTLSVRGKVALSVGLLSLVISLVTLILSSDTSSKVF